MADEENTLIQGADNLYFEAVEGENARILTLEEQLHNQFVGILLDRYIAAQQARDFDEQRWITAYHNYRGIYPKHLKFRESEKSKVLLKLQKLKYLQPTDSLLMLSSGQIDFQLELVRPICQRALQSMLI